MAKKARKKNEVAQGVQPPTSPFDEMFPTISRGTWLGELVMKVSNPSSVAAGKLDAETAL